MIGGIVVTHGPIASAAIEAAETILGETKNIHPVTTTNSSLKSVIQELEDIISRNNRDQGLIIMVSLKGGTCWNSAVSVARQHKNVEVVSGVNLPMIISFLTKRDVLPLGELAETIRNNGIRGIDRA
ncbi:hypothetical protein B6I21_05200 [candidate division KSB1 bacterium 4572_119]|nr:MAG: hypothetical protein B6I21_05200 [candidate division KSB1 bacterium 4572_119]